jgi:hypothetical protein
MKPLKVIIQIHNFVDIEETTKNRKPFLFDGKNTNEAIEFFESNYDMNEQRKASFLVSSFGGKWPYIGRRNLATKFIDILMERFVQFSTNGQPDKEINSIPFSSTIRGAGKSKANQEMIHVLRSITSAEIYHKLNSATNTYFDEMVRFQ